MSRSCTEYWVQMLMMVMMMMVLRGGSVEEKQEGAASEVTPPHSLANPTRHQFPQPQPVPQPRHMYCTYSGTPFGGRYYII